MNEQLEGFLHDLDEASAMLEVVGGRGHHGCEYFAALSLLVKMLISVYQDDDEIVLTPEDEKLVITAYSLIARANKIIRMKGLISQGHMGKVANVGSLLDQLWFLVPGGDELKKKTPPTVRRDHPAWSTND